MITTCHHSLIPTEAALQQIGAASEQAAPTVATSPPSATAATAQQLSTPPPFLPTLGLPHPAATSQKLAVFNSQLSPLPFKFKLDEDTQPSNREATQHN